MAGSSSPSLLQSVRAYTRQGEPWVWVTAGAIGLVMLMLVGMLLVVLANGVGYFWPHKVHELAMADGTRKLAVIVDEGSSTEGVAQVFVRVGNRDLYGADFEWLAQADITAQTVPEDAVVLERVEHGPFFGYLVARDHGGQRSEIAWDQALAMHSEVAEQQRGVDDLLAELSQRNEELYGLDTARRKAEYYGDSAEHLTDLAGRSETLRADIEVLQSKYEDQLRSLRSETLVVRDARGQEKVVALVDVLNMYQPNRMSLMARVSHYVREFWHMLSENPRESNTEGGIFPALFGTAVMVLLMSLFSMPLGVITAIYLREYVRDGRTLRLIRIAVNNLAGVPSIVYGVFGLGFLIYTVGSALDAAFYPYMAPTPVFGTGGILWASITLSLLTVPVVVVATEEALAAIPKEIREASLALGATRFQTLWRVLLPMATPGILTGFILSMARAAGEVAPLMLTGAVKLAPTLPLDGSFPLLHLDRKFMHLGFHIYDLAFQSPNVDAVKPLVYVTTLLLLLLVFLLSIAAMVLRNRMRRKYSTGAF